MNESCLLRNISSNLPENMCFSLGLHCSVDLACLFSENVQGEEGAVQMGTVGLSPSKMLRLDTKQKPPATTGPSADFCSSENVLARINGFVLRHWVD